MVVDARRLPSSVRVASIDSDTPGSRVPITTRCRSTRGTEAWGQVHDRADVVETVTERDRRRPETICHIVSCVIDYVSGGVEVV